MIVIGFSNSIEIILHMWIKPANLLSLLPNQSKTFVTRCINQCAKANHHRLSGTMRKRPTWFSHFQMSSSCRRGRSNTSGQETARRGVQPRCARDFHAAPYLAVSSRTFPLGLRKSAHVCPRTSWSIPLLTIKQLFAKPRCGNQLISKLDQIQVPWKL